MNEKDYTINQEIDPDTAPDLTKDSWPEKFAKASVRLGQPLPKNPKSSATTRLPKRQHGPVNSGRLDVA